MAENFQAILDGLQLLRSKALLERNKQQKEKLLQSQPKLSSLSSSSSSHNLLSGAANKRPHGSTAHGAVDSSSAKVQRRGSVLSSSGTAVGIDRQKAWLLSKVDLATIESILKRKPDGTFAAVLGGNEQLPAHGIAEVVTLLRRRHPYWPCPLDTFVTPHEVAQSKAKAEEEDAAAADAAEEMAPPPTQEGVYQVEFILDDRPREEEADEGMEYLVGEHDIAHGLIKKYTRIKNAEEEEDLELMAEDDDDAEEDENDACAVCYGMEGDDDNQLVFCDCCDAAYHQECHRPKITEAMIDEPKWYCQKIYCQRKGKEEAEVVKFRAAQKEKSEEEKVLLEEKREKRRLRLEAMARRSHKAGGAKKNRLKGLKAKFNARRR
eukprot:gene6016-7994_t